MAVNRASSPSSAPLERILARWKMGRDPPRNISCIGLLTAILTAIYVGLKINRLAEIGGGWATQPSFRRRI